MKVKYLNGQGCVLLSEQCSGRARGRKIAVHWAAPTPDDATRKAVRRAVREAQASLEKNAEAVRKERRKAFADAQAAGLCSAASKRRPGDGLRTGGRSAVRCQPAGRPSVSRGHQEELSFCAGLHRTEIGQLERSIRDPKSATLLKLAGALSLPPGDLLKGMAWTSGVTQTGRFVVRLDADRG